jgi:hypothetical protein
LGVLRFDALYELMSTLPCNATAAAIFLTPSDAHSAEATGLAPHVAWPSSAEGRVLLSLGLLVLLLSLAAAWLTHPWKQGCGRGGSDEETLPFAREA